MIPHNDPQNQAKRIPPCTDADTLAEAIAQLCEQAGPSGSAWSACCPAHDDANPSLSITPDNSRVLLCCHAGCDIDSLVQALGITKADLFLSYSAPKRPRREVHVYDYRSADGTLLHQTVRYDPKDFKQR